MDNQVQPNSSRLVGNRPIKIFLPNEQPKSMLDLTRTKPHRLDWLQFGAYLKMRRDKVIAAGGYWLPYYLSDSNMEQWVVLTEQVKASLLAGEAPDLLLICPVCGTKGNSCKLLNIKFDYETWMKNLAKRYCVTHVDRLHACIAFEDSLPIQMFKQYIEDLRDAMGINEPLEANVGAS